MAGKYAALEQYLLDLPAGQQGVILTFQEIEQILAQKLPYSAYTYLKWWSHENQPRSPQKQAFVRAGWRLCTLSLPQQWIQLIREAPDDSLTLPGRVAKLENVEPL